MAAMASTSPQTVPMVTLRCQGATASVDGVPHHYPAAITQTALAQVAETMAAWSRQDPATWGGQSHTIRLSNECSDLALQM